MLNRTKIIFLALVLFIVTILLGYFFWPKKFNTSNEDEISISIHKDKESITYYYDLNEQEVNDFVKILEESKFRRGVPRPDRMFDDQLIQVIVQGGLSPVISIYYDTDKTYVFANISNGIILNDYYRISNKEEIKIYIEKIISTKNDEFEEVPSN